MNLATRCGACQVLFRVVPDQLRVSEGWVRCGRCDTVFDALEHLFDLDLPTAPDASEPTRTGWVAGEVVANDAAATHEVVTATATATETGTAPADASTTDTSTDVERIETAARVVAPPPAGFDAPFDLALPDAEADARLVEIGPTPFGAASGFGPGDGAPMPTVAGRPLPEPLFADLDPGGTDPDPPTGVHAGADASLVAEPPLFARASLLAPPAPRPRRTRALAALAVLLALALAGQALFQARETLAARWPATEPLFAGACAALGCRLDAPRRLDALAVENTALAMTARPGAYRLSIGLRNRADIRAALPAFELALTDTDGQLLARRVLAARDFDKAPTSIAAGDELALQALLAFPDGRVVSGYTVEIFYP